MYLSAESLQPMWQVLRKRLERTGHAIRGTVNVELDDEGADRLGGLLGRAFPTGSAVVKVVSQLPVQRKVAPASFTQGRVSAASA